MIDFKALALIPLVKTLGEPFKYFAPGSDEVIPLENPGLKFDEAYEAIQVGSDGTEISTTLPAALAILSDFPAGHPCNGGILQRDKTGQRYEILGLESTGNGGAVLPLHKVS